MKQKGASLAGVKAEVAIHTLGAGGDGIGLYDGQRIFVPKTMIGDQVEVKITQERSEGLQGKLLKVLSPGPQRKAPPCPYFARCGSCALQHLEIGAYQTWKAQSVYETLSRAGVEPAHWDAPVFLPPASRRRVTLSAVKTQNGLVLGYNEARSHQVLDIKACLILEPALDAFIQTFRAPLLEAMEECRSLDVTIQHIDGQFDVVLCGALEQGGRFTYNQHEAFGAMIRSGAAQLSWKKKTHAPPEMILQAQPIIKTFGALQVEIAPGAFLQASQAAETAISERILAYLGEGPLNVADLFCGAGTFTGRLVKKARTIYAADSDALSIQALQNAARTHEGISIERRDLFREPLSAQKLAEFDAVIFDPPRAGAQAQTQNLAASGAARIIGVSCNPASFARDAKTLIAAGYVLERAQMIDQFVYSAHSEIVALFVKA